MNQSVAENAQGNEGAHKRIHERLKEYWDKIRGDRKYPGENEIRPHDIGDIWDSCFLIHVDNDAMEKGFKYAYLGLSLIEAYGDDLTGHEICDHIVSPGSELMVQEFHKVVDSGEPVVDENSFTNSKNMLVKYRSIMLPLGSSPEKVEYIIGGMKWKAY